MLDPCPTRAPPKAESLQPLKTEWLRGLTLLAHFIFFSPTWTLYVAAKELLKLSAALVLEARSLSSHTTVMP